MQAMLHIRLASRYLGKLKPLERLQSKSLDRTHSIRSEKTFLRAVHSDKDLRVAEKMKVLFCSHHFTDGFRFTQEFLGDDPSIQVVRCGTPNLNDNVRDASVLVPQMARIDSETIARAKKLQMILQFGVGLEGVDIDAATKAGVIVARIPGVASGNAPSCAEMAIYLILALLRNQRGMAEAVAASRLGTPTGRTLQGLTVLIVGYGAIGRELAVRLKTFGVRILALRVSSGRPLQESSATNPAAASSTLSEQPAAVDVSPEKSSTSDTEAAARLLTSRANGAQPSTSGRSEPESLLDGQGGLDERDELLAQADIIVLSCLLTKETRGMVNESFLRRMKRDAVLVNIARGHLLEYDSVLAALQAGQLAGLGMDVAWSEPFDPKDPVARHPNVILTPHVAGVSDKSYRTMAEIIAASVKELHEGRPFSRIEVVHKVRDQITGN